MRADSRGLTSPQLDMLNRGTRQLGLDVSTGQVESIVLYLSLVNRWREQINLVSLANERELISHHALDSLALAPFLEESRKVLDIGTGAGFPGMLLAAVKPRSEFYLLDSRMRRVEFLRMVNARLKLGNLHFICDRVEALSAGDQFSDLGQSGVQIPAKFDTLVARAVASLEQLVTLTLPLQAAGVRLLAMKGQYPREELKKLEAQHSDRLLSVQVEPLRIPYLDAQRHVVIVRFK